ncbi:MAG: DUF7380 domain-containing protein [Acetobacteraceae bacterium]
MPLTVPEPIRAALNRFDESRAPFEEHNVSFALKNAIRDPADLDDAERLGMAAEISAFSYTSPLSGDSSAWDTHFGPMATCVRKDGTEVYIPDIRQADASFIEHWTNRAVVTHHPILRARYADLAWDFTRLVTNQRPDVAHARIAIDAYIEAVECACYTTPHQAAGFAARALSLALSLNDTARIKEVKDAIFQLYQAHRRPIHGGLWSLPFDLLYDAKGADLSENERDAIVGELKTVLQETSSRVAGSGFDPWEAEAAATRLERHYRKVQRSQDLHRVLLAYGNAFESAAQQAEPMLANAWLQPVYEKYRAIGLSEDATRILLALERDALVYALPPRSMLLFHRAIQTSGDSTSGHRALGPGIFHG